MRKITNNGLLMCDLQANTFEKSIDRSTTSSEIFIRRFAFSDIAERFDNESILNFNIQPNDILEYIDEEFGPSNYGSVKYTQNEMYWIGYIYRYFAFTYEISSKHAYKIIKPKELKGLFLPYHTMDPSQAIERILEAKNISFDEEALLNKQYEIFRRIRKEVSATS